MPYEIQAKPENVVICSTSFHLSYHTMNNKGWYDYSAKSGCLLFLFNINGSVRKTILSGVCSIIKTLTFLIIFIPITITIGMIDIKGPRNYYSVKGVNFGLLLSSSHKIGRGICFWSLVWGNRPNIASFGDICFFVVLSSLVS